MAISSCIPIVDLCIPLEDWSETFQFEDEDASAISIDDARMVIKTADGVTELFDLTVANARVTITDNVVAVQLAYADLAANTETEGVWDLLIQRAADSKLKRWLRGAVTFPLAVTPDISP